jgi:pimeloyl-ACP methyl ester carboxylesterase
MRVVAGAFLRTLLLAVLLTGTTAAQEHVSFATQDGALIYANVYGKGERGVVLAHGGRFNKESWEKQARQLAQTGFLAMAIDLRGYGQSRGPGQADPMSAPLTGMFSRRFGICERRAQRRWQWLEPVWEVGRRSTLRLNVTR